MCIVPGGGRVFLQNQLDRAVDALCGDGRYGVSPEAATPMAVGVGSGAHLRVRVLIGGAGRERLAGVECVVSPLVSSFISWRNAMRFMTWASDVLYRGT